MHKLYYRGYQKLMKAAMKNMPWRTPLVVEGVHSLDRLPALVSAADISRLFVVTDKGILEAGLIDVMLEQLEMRGIHCTVYSDTLANPTVQNVEAAVGQYYEAQSEGIVAFGGGSAMDCAKCLGARIARPDKSLSAMRGVFKLRRNMPPFFAVPTTAGTGSEGTLAAVLSDRDTHEKYVLMDTSLIPHVAVLDPYLTLDLPQEVTAMTGMDALTHAVEAYIGRSNTKATASYAKEAVRLVFDNLEASHNNGHDLKARREMQQAAFKAGLAFTRAYVGNIHAIAHTLGGHYNVPHGWANAVIMPHVLGYYGAAVHKPLSELADVAGIGLPTETEAVKAAAFIAAIRKMNEKMGIPEKVEGIKGEDIPGMIEKAYREANPLYPVPVIFDRSDFEHIYNEIRK
ncbi:iron-containing alcohol dehydrogenase [Salinicoccus roseus]|uniref:Alcohol dehydrogenase n=1 Tax=Salinicoccus roseus TaxID=45670 RepID=A0A0C2DMT8_9STAP|nr:iron-containing alcohol dehydrogenase [Salinicoccus roseus]KIH71323.1 alcohol dehydrogenase [Salinicoccus roseus]MDB0580066.1 iron-containing alcohol dehydrogenase [Salinicoccus roseus]